MHGAFRGGWVWDEVAEQLSSSGVEVFAPTLVGMDPEDPHAGECHLDDWVRQIDAAAGSAALVVGHSMGAVVAQATALRSAHVTKVLLLDGPVITTGQRAIDVSGPVPDELPGHDAWVLPQPVGTASGLNELQCEWVNARLVPTPVGPQLDVLRGADDLSREIVFCANTPNWFPSSFSRRRCDQLGVPYALWDEPHEVMLTNPTRVAEWVLAAMSAS